jgi:hypothetical protein
MLQKPVLHANRCANFREEQMNMEEKPTQSQKADENAVCDSCGRYGAYDFCGTHLCVDCYGARGACCPEFGAEDLTEDEGKAESGLGT